MQTLSFGYLLPETGDKGADLFASLGLNISQVNSHNHDGVNSALIAGSSIASSTQDIPASGWASYGGPIGHFRQLVTLPSGFQFDSCAINFRSSTGSYVYPSVERVTNTSFYVYSIDPTLDLVSVYGG